MNTNEVKHKRELEKSFWQATVAKYQNPQIRRSVWQIVNSIIPYFVLCYLMYRSLEISYWITLGLAVLAAGFLTRIFIIFHDCGHGSFFTSRKINDILGFITGIVTYTPYHQWRHDHAVHHATSSDLDRRGVGDIWMLTVQEYKKSSPLKRLGYRLYRTPVVMFGVGALYLFLIRNRFAGRSAGRRERQSVYWTNLALLSIVSLLSVTIGLTNLALVQLPIVMIGMAAGVWLFYLQHQFAGVYWERHEHWDYVRGALEGSSFYKLPKILQWFTGNIGFHHIHHLSPRIPNYYLERCHKENAVFQGIKPLTLLSSLRSLTLRLWDDEGKSLVGYRILKTRQG
jgi:omega-6 fatty acid desaturase (delta-12 desaturase)